MYLVDPVNALKAHGYVKFIGVEGCRIIACNIFAEPIFNLQESALHIDMSDLIWFLNIHQAYEFRTSRTQFYMSGLMR